MSDRRTQIAEAGVRVLSTRGARALTHRAIDEELGLATGSTSYYARSRRELVNLIVGYLAERTEGELIAPRLPEVITPASIAGLLVDELDATGERADDHRARLLLLLEHHDDAELQAALTTSREVQRAFVTTASSVLELLDVAEPAKHARGLIGLLEGLRARRIVGGLAIDEREILTAYLAGLPRIEAGRPPANPAAAARGLLNRIRRPGRQ